ncbi:transposase, partial [Escherichia coli]|nr:transposase [Escherichia coli]
KKVIPDSPNLVFISDIKNSIAKAIEQVFPSANRLICFFHLKNNIITTFGKIFVFTWLKKTASMYCEDEFDKVMEEIRRVNPK